jgi:hypothetical protein
MGEPLELIEAAADEALVEKGACRLHGGRGGYVCVGWMRRKWILLQLPEGQSSRGHGRRVCYGSGHVLQTAGIVWWDGELEALSPCNALWLMKLFVDGFYRTSSAISHSTPGCVPTRDS